MGEDPLYGVPWYLQLELMEASNLWDANWCVCLPATLVRQHSLF